MRTSRLAILLLSLLVGCGSSSSSSTPEPAAAPTDPASATTDPASGEAPREAAPTPQGRERVRYDLAAHVARAELRQGEAQVIDLGVPGGHKYTLGGWRTRIGRDVRETVHVEGGSDQVVTSSIIENVTGFVIVPSDVAGPRTLRIRARAVRDGRMTAYIDQETIGLATLPTDGSYATARIDVSAERLHVGENSVQLRVPSTGAAAGASSAGVLIDWIRLGPADDPHAEEAPPSPERLAVRADGSAGAADTLAIPAGWALGYAMEVWPSARVRGTVRGSGSLEVIAHRDGAEARTLGTVRASEAGAPLDLDLTSLAGQVVRIDLRATGDLRVVRPRVITLDAPEAEASAPPRMRNVLVYLTDTLRADHLRPYRADTRVRTPALDAWTAGAAVMLRGHSQENWTKPSVATLLSGLFPWEHHATTEDAIVPGSVELLSERLGREGFRTGAFVANGFCSDRFGFRQGWSTFRNYVREGMRGQAEFVAADVLDWLDHRPNPDQPFFLYVHTIDPHVPYMPPREALALYDPEPYEGIVDFNRDRELLEGVKSGRIDLNARDRVRLEALYDGEITYHDTHFGAIMSGLASRGLDDDTIVVFTADHGEEFWDHDSVGHGHSVWEELINVPLIVRVPGITDGAMRIEDSVGLVDVMPTVYESLGMQIPDDLSGESFLPMLRGRSPDAPRAAVTGFMEGWRAVNVGRLKLVHRTERRVMLYDLVDDPDETRDLAAERPLAVRYARGMLGLALAEAEAPAHRRVEISEERIVIDDVTRQQLEALGYAGASRAGTGDTE